MNAVIQEISGCETVMLHHLINASNAGRSRFRVTQDDWEMHEGHFRIKVHNAVHRGRMIPPIVHRPHASAAGRVCLEHNKTKSSRESIASALASSECMCCSCLSGSASPNARPEKDGTCTLKIQVAPPRFRWKWCWKYVMWGKIKIWYGVCGKCPSSEPNPERAQSHSLNFQLKMLPARLQDACIAA